MSIPRLAFRNLAFGDQLARPDLTARLGSDRLADLVAERKFVALDRAGKFLGVAEVTSVVYCPLAGVRPEWLEYWHSGPVSLLEFILELQEHYPGEVASDSYVTLVWFRFQKKGERYEQQQQPIVGNDGVTPVGL